MKKIAVTVAVLLASVSVSFGDGGNNPADTGNAQSRNSGGISLDRAWAIENPALVGLESRRQSRLSLFPTNVTLWNDKVALPFAAASSVKSYVAMLMRESFGIRKGLSPEEVSGKLTDELRDGMYMYVGAQSAPVVFATGGFGVNVRNFGDADIKIPGGFLLPFFSATEGLLADNSLNVSDTRIRAMWASEIGFKLGRRIAVPFIGDYLSLNDGAAGVGVKLLYGHYYFSVEAKENSALYYDHASNKYNTNASFDVLNADKGYGVGFDLGTVFHNDNHAVSIDVQDIGVMRWSGKQKTITVGNLDLNDQGADFSKTGAIDKNCAVWLPTALNVGYLYRVDMAALYGDGPGILLDYLSASLVYNQQLVLGIGKNTYSPRVSAWAMLGFLKGYLPVRYGIIGGGPEKLASTAGVGFDAKRGSLELSYKAVGNPILLPKKGFEVAFSQTSAWGGKGKAKTKGKTPQPVPPIDTASAPPPIAQEEITDTLPAPAPPIIQETSVDTIFVAPPAVKETSVDTVPVVPPAIQEAPIDTLPAPPAIQETPVDTLPAPPAIQETPVDTLPAPPAIQEAPVDTLPESLLPEFE